MKWIQCCSLAALCAGVLACSNPGPAVDPGAVPSDVPTGDPEFDDRFEIIDGNICPVVHYSVAVPASDTEGDRVVADVVASDPDGGPVSIMWSATAGELASPNALSTVYDCGDALGPQVLSAVVSDGHAACDRVVELDVVCEGQTAGDEGACNNPTDLTTLHNLTIGDDAAVICLDSCIGDGTDLSNDCADCYEEAGTCSAQLCQWECGCFETPEGCSEEALGWCYSCVNNNCGQAFRECAGIEGPAPSEPTPTYCQLDGGFYILDVSEGAFGFGCEPSSPIRRVRMHLDVTPPDPDCMHDVTVRPNRTYFEPLCVQGALSMSIQQTACGGGRIDSNGGSDFTLTETVDTSSPGICGGAHPECATGADSSFSSLNTVGDGLPDLCLGRGPRANVAFGFPAEAVTWMSASGECPDCDNAFHPYPHCGCNTIRRGVECSNPGGTDPICGGDEECLGPDEPVSRLPMFLDLTTDTATASFEDIYPDGCSFAGPGCAAPQAASGGPNTCLNPLFDTVTLHGAGPMGYLPEPGGPSYEGLWTTTMTGTLTRFGTYGGHTCDDPSLVFDSEPAPRCYE